MNFAAQYAKVIEKLGENPTSPQFWSVAELKDYVNRGFREFAKQTGHNTIKAPMALVDSGRHIVPSNMLRLMGVYFQGRPLERRSIDYLESKFAGKGHYAGLRGDSPAYSDSASDWRLATGTPEAWYYEEGRICLYPIPESLLTASQVRTKQSGILASGVATITLPTAIVQDENYAWLFLDGDYQNGDAFEITNPNLITVDVAPPNDRSYTVVGFASQATGAVRTFKVRYTATADQSYFRIPRGYVPGTNAIDFAKDGTTQDPSSFIEVDSYTVKTVTPLAEGTMVEITVHYSASLTANTEARYIVTPSDLVADGELPDLPDAFHDAGWQWAVFEALSREGRGKDVEKASLYSSMFAKTVQDWLDSFGEKAGPDAPGMPFVV